MIKQFIALSAFLITGSAAALDIKPYSAQALETEQAAGRAVSLHFHADWCPTCRAQEAVFKQWQGDASVPGTLLVVDFDKEKDLKRALNVRSQSTLIVFRGKTEKARSGGETEPGKLRTALESAK